jgi:environmental stress-induced protein Ves
MNVRQFSNHEYRRMRWKNGLGWTSEILVDPPEGEWSVRISIAEVDADSEFSRFPGIDRSLLVLDGAGMVLDVEGQGSTTLTADGPPLAFPGDVATSSRLVAGPTRDFNVMTRRGVVSHTLRRQALAGSMVLECAPASSLLIYSIDGDVTLDELALAPGDSALVDDRDTRAMVTLGGTSTVLVVELFRD